jgi:hypothetical protein
VLFEVASGGRKGGLNQCLLFALLGQHKYLFRIDDIKSSTITTKVSHVPWINCDVFLICIGEYYRSYVRSAGFMYALRILIETECKCYWLVRGSQGHGAWQFTINRDMEALISDTIRFLLLLTFRKLRNIFPPFIL